MNFTDDLNHSDIAFIEWPAYWAKWVTAVSTFYPSALQDLFWYNVESLHKTIYFKVLTNTLALLKEKYDKSDSNS